MRIGVIAAMSKECRLIENLLTDKKNTHGTLYEHTHGILGRNEVCLMQSGIGKVNAAIGTEEMIREFHPDCIINSGVAGGLVSSLNRTDIVVGEKTAYHDVWCGEGDWGQVQGLPPFFEGDRSLIERIMQTENRLRIRKGLICTGDQFITNNETLKEIKRHFHDALAVDMEAAAIAQVCYLHHMPMLSIRIISDVPGSQTDQIDDYNQFFAQLSEQSFSVLKKLFEIL